MTGTEKKSLNIKNDFPEILLGKSKNERKKNFFFFGKGFHIFPDIYRTNHWNNTNEEDLLQFMKLVYIASGIVYLAKP